MLAVNSRSLLQKTCSKVRVGVHGQHAQLSLASPAMTHLRVAQAPRNRLSNKNSLLSSSKPPLRLHNSRLLWSSRFKSSLSSNQLSLHQQLHSRPQSAVRPTPL